MEFNSQICTTRRQSERLLALGLNPETADMKHIPYSDYVVPKEYDLFLGWGEKAKLFNVIKAKGYKWNIETKTLEKLITPKFKVGDRIVRRGCSISNSWIVSSINSEYYGLKLPEDVESIGVLNISEQDNYELLPNTNKFDITTLKPFDKVLVRCGNNGLWEPQFFAKYNPNSKFPFTCTYNSWTQCIPYEGNKHLLATTKDCDEYYKVWG